MIAEHVNGIERHQRVHGPPRIERTARHVAEIDDLANSLRADVGQHGFQREIVSVHIGNRGKTHVNSTYPEGCFSQQKQSDTAYLIWVKPQRNMRLASFVEPEFLLAASDRLG